MKEIEKIKDLTKKIDGWLSDNEGEMLYNLAKNVRGKGVIVEIGSWKGKSTIWLGRGSKSNSKAKIYAIDPHIGSLEHKKIYGRIWTFEEFKQNIKMAGIEDIVIPIVNTSQEAGKNWAGEPIELLWIDGDHEENLVELDHKIWEPFLIEGGVIAFHDTMSDGPKKVVDKHLYLGNKFKSINFVEGTTFAEKSSNILRKDKLRNRYMLLLRNLYIHYSSLNKKFFNGKFHLPKTVKTILKKLFYMNF